MLRSGGLELIVENKVDDKLEEKQLRQYLDYAQQRPNAHIVVASRDHNPVVEKYILNPQFPQFKGEILWWQIADRWNKRKADFSKRCLVDGILEFMKEHRMGAFEPFLQEELISPNLCRSFMEKTDKILDRLHKVVQPEWPHSEKYKANGVFSGGKVGVFAFNGLLWSSPANTGAGQADFWYFVGFRYGSLEGLLPLLEASQPECIAFVGAWPPERVRELMAEEAKQLSAGLSAPAFEVDDSENGVGVFLFRRRQLKDFIEESDQAAAILGFLEQSHKKLEPVVPKIHEQHRLGT